MLRSPNELEFRAYYLLMFLLDRRERDAASVLRRLSPSGMSDPHIAFVLDVMAAVDSNNTRTFFKLLRTRATHLQACLLHRYVPDVRVDALRVLRRAYRPAAPDFAFVHDRLCFDSPAHTLAFLQALGLLPPHATLATVVPGGAHTSVDLTTLADGVGVAAGAVPHERELVPELTGRCSRRAVVDVGLWALEADVPQLARAGGAGGAGVLRIPCSLTASQRQRRVVVSFKDADSWLCVGDTVQH